MASSNGDQPSDDKERLADRLLKTECVKFGDYVLKSGSHSKYYVNLRDLDPELTEMFVKSITKILSAIDTAYPCAIVGVPYGVWPVASAAAYEAKLRFVQIRKETKEYGIKSTGTDQYQNYKFVLIEDVMSTGSSIIETMGKMDSSKVTDVIVLVDRELGGSANLAKAYPNVKLHSVLKLPEILELSRNYKMVPQKVSN